MKSKCSSKIMEWCLKKMGKRSSTTRGLSDHHSHTTHSSSTASQISVPNQTAPTTSSFLMSVSPPYAIPYEAPEQVINSRPQGMKVYVGGNENKEGQQEIDEIEIGNSSNGVVSPIFGNNVGKIDMKIGNNINVGQYQKIGKVKFGNAG
ncbi:hypothetical protein RND81_14G245000 [Saponaria officinalis]|uniref:Uncharacterized protein n=1 Tax=Saponaria officinalis TaxID=3572 RepID=A0AAW1GU79_SAPOF